MPISPSSYDLLSRCPRAWYYRYVAKAKIPTKEHLARGTAIHTAVEGYLETGAFSADTPPEILARAEKNVGYLMALRQGAYQDAQIEAWVTLDLEPYGGVDSLRGRLDWSGRTLDGVGVILDHKSTANPRNFETPESIVLCHPLHAYAAGTFPGEDVIVGHLYYPEDPYEGELVRGAVSKDAISETLYKYAAATKRIKAIREVDGPPEPNTDHCWDYGGCDYALHCPFAPESLKNRLRPDSQPEGEFTPVAKLTAKQKAQRAALGISNDEPASDTTPEADAPTEAAPAAQPPSSEATGGASPALSVAPPISDPEEVKREFDRKLAKIGVVPPDAPPPQGPVSEPEATPKENEPEPEAAPGREPEAAEEQKPAKKPRKPPTRKKKAEPEPEPEPAPAPEPDFPDFGSAPVQLVPHAMEGWDQLHYMEKGVIQRFSVIVGRVNMTTGHVALSSFGPLNTPRHHVAIEDPLGRIYSVDADGKPVYFNCASDWEESL